MDTDEEQDREDVGEFLEDEIIQSEPDQFDLLEMNQRKSKKT